jgi:hypothetical protein
MDNVLMKGRMMFRNGKLTDKKKAKKRHTLAFYIIGIFTFAIEAMLGINAAFLIDQSMGIVAHNMLDGTPVAAFGGLITLVISLAIGFCFIFGGMWTFTGFMDSLDDAKAYKDYYGTGEWPVRMVWSLEVAVVALDLMTLCFRATYFTEKGAFWLFIFFLILIFMPPVLGPLIHVLENTPRDRRLAKAYRHVEQLEADDISLAVEAMAPDLRTRYLDGDQDALQEHYERVEALREDNHAYEQEQMRRRDEKKQRAYAPPTAPLAGASLTQTGKQRSEK